MLSVGLGHTPLDLILDGCSDYTDPELSWASSWWTLDVICAQQLIRSCCASRYVPITGQEAVVLGDDVLSGKASQSLRADRRCIGVTLRQPT